MRICIIDDDSICHLIIKKLVPKLLLEFELSHFQNGMEAVDFIKYNQLHPSLLPELILLDINMPVASGWDFLKMLDGLNIQGYHPQIFICSSSLHSKDLAMAKTFAEVDGFLNKPIDIMKLKTVFSKSNSAYSKFEFTF